MMTIGSQNNEWANVLCMSSHLLLCAHTPPRGMIFWRIELKVQKTWEKCPNPPSWHIMTTPREICAIHLCPHVCVWVSGRLGAEAHRYAGAQAHIKCGSPVHAVP